MAARAAPFWLLAAALVAAASAQSSGSGGGDCTSALVSLSPCMDYISGNGTSAPSASCCSQLKAVVQSKPQCLCAALSGDSSSLGVTIDKKRALELPKACNVDTPPASKCNCECSTKPTPRRRPPVQCRAAGAAGSCVVAQSNYCN